MKKILNLIQILLLSLFIFTMTNCTKNKLTETLNQPLITPHKIYVYIDDVKNGDLIFVSAQEENLSGAINRVTKTTEEQNYDHVGLIEKTKDSTFVLHASPNGGSLREEINQFYKNQSKNNNTINIYRLLYKHQNTINNAILMANSMVGKPYNWEYILNEESYYCSDFIERSFRKDSIFELISMNFKNPSTGKIDDFWLDFYKKRNLNVPQDQPGTNPNQLAKSDKLYKIGPLFINLQ